MHVGGDGTNVLHGNVLRQELVELVWQVYGCPLLLIFPVEVRHHHACMDAGIGPPCSDDLDGLPQKCGECNLQSLLHAVAIGLNLPAVVARAVVGEGDEETHGLIHNYKFIIRKSVRYSEAEAFFILSLFWII